MFRQTHHMARPAAAGVLRAAVSSLFPDARLIAAAAASATDTALAAAAAVAADGARG
ncbi:hypothetical protein G4Z16_30865 [Streptomyces bathyalis]|uniref:Uncharacterized protein n=1 Tax=Streptomyces bathyalis TaxID=2710756 RepID=A0A7T1TBS1_9ACTN|nr:hypothetical protein [Streptomyces bathyalis]QPP10093.1 hypothetical protein G4Z16_30865 [Streptomyces bathyalis]